MERKKLEFSKIILFFVASSAIVVSVVAVIATFVMSDTSLLSILIPSVFAELATATAGYYWKSRSENKLKMILGFINDLPPNATENTDIINNLISNL